MVVLGPLSYCCPRCGSSSHLDEHPDGKGFVEGSCLRCGEGWVRRADWGAVQCPRCSSTNVCEEDIDETSVIFECNACFQRWMRPVQEAISRMVRVAPAQVHEVQMLDGSVALTYPSSQEEEPERREQPVLRGRTYWMREGEPVHTIEVDAPAPAGAYAYQNRIGVHRPDGTVAWENDGPWMGMGQEPERSTRGCGECGSTDHERAQRDDPSYEYWKCLNCGHGWRVVKTVTVVPSAGPVPTCVYCRSNAHVVQLADEGFIHWNCQGCGVGWKYRDDSPAILTQGVPPSVEDRFEAQLQSVLTVPADLEWITEATVAHKTANGVAATDEELETLLLRSRREAVAAREAVEMRRYLQLRAGLLYGSVGIGAGALVMFLLAIWSPIFGLEFGATALLGILVSWVLFFIRKVHLHPPNKSLTRKGD
jgi:ssDNA-binding Zn-finger/Zn-ribbon topoisomerase 1